MSDLEDSSTSYADVSDDFNSFEHSEISSLHADLLADVEESIVTKSTPSSPSRLAFRDISPVRTASAPVSPHSVASTVNYPRSSSVKNLVSKFEFVKPSIMAANAKKEAADFVRKISYAKGWVTRSLNKLETLLLAGNDVLDPSEFRKQSDQLQDQFDKLLDLQISIGDIYAKHNAEAQFKVISEEIDLIISTSTLKLNDYALKVNRGAAALPPDQITKAELLTAMSQMGHEHVKKIRPCIDPLFENQVFSGHVVFSKM